MSTVAMLRLPQPGMLITAAMMIAIPAIRSLIRQGRIHEVNSLIQTGRKYGMFTMDQAVEDLIALKKIDQEWFETNYFDVSATSRKAG